MNDKASQKPGESDSKPTHDASARPFSFGAKRYVSTGPRRLFVPRKGMMAPILEPETERGRPLLRIFSNPS